MKSNFTIKWSVALCFLFSLGLTVSLNAQSITITAPASVAGNYPVKPAAFGPAITATIAGDLELVIDDTAPTGDGCETVTNDLTGKIALVDRGACGFTVKAINTQTAGAALVIVCNSVANAGLPAIIMGGDDMGVMTVPSVMMTYDDCEILKAELANGLTGTGNPVAPGESCSTAFVVGEGTHTAPALSGGGSLFNDAMSTAWYSYTPATDGLLNINSCGGGADTRFYVWTDGCDLANITAIATNDDACDLGNGDEYASSLDFLVTGGTEYWISWDDHWDASGFDFSITLGALPIVDVEVTVDMSNETVDPAGAHIAGAFNGWSSVPMTDNGDGTYTYTITGITAGDTLEYLFQNGLNTNWEGFPAFGGGCTVTTPDGAFTNRFLVGPITNSTLGTVCFNSCDLCPPPACSDPDAIICDDLEMYTLDLVSAQAAHWTPWGLTPGAGDDAIVSDAQAASGTQSLLVSEANGDDMLLLLGDQTSGNYLLTWKMYIPTGATGYFNTQKIEGSPGTEFGMQVEFFADGTSTLDAGAADVVTVNWTADTWMNISLNVDLDNDWIVYSIDGVEVYSWPASWGTFVETGMLQLGAINFFGNTGTEQYIDDVLFKELPGCPADAVICDGYEAYVSGTTTGGQAPWWSTWSGVFGTAEDGIVSSDQAFDGSNSMLIGDNGAQDVLLLLGNQTTGNWRIEMQMYVPTGNIGYYNIQDDEAPGQQWNMEAWFNGSNANPSVYTPGMGQLASGETFACPQSTWFEVSSDIDLDNRTHTLTVDGVVVLDAVDYPAGDKIGAIDFFSISPDNTAYFDAIRLIELEPVVVDPDPVNVTFNVNMEFEVVAAGGAHIAGEMNGWTGEPMTDNGDLTYSSTYLLAVGDTVEYKFQNGLDGWEDNFDDAGCGMNNNRFVIVGESDMTIDLVCFNDCVNCFISADDLAFQNAISIYPNPASDFTTIEYNFNEANDLKIELNNSLGQQISSELLGSAQNGTHQMNLSNLATGIYFIQITNGEQTMVEKLFVE
jgi:type IX secretion system substrate protein/PA domain-containing protein